MAAARPVIQPRPVAPELSVVIPTLGREILRDCLASVLAGTIWPATVILVDQGDQPGVAAWMEELLAAGLAAEHVRSTQRGTAAAMNRGLERVRTPFVAVTHDDCRVDAAWLERMAARLRADPDAIITGRVLPEPGGVGFTPSINTAEHEVAYTRPLLDRDPLFPANMGFALRTATSVGPFIEADLLRFAEDAEWSYRALRNGVRMIYAPEVVVEHRDWRSEKQVAGTYRGYARSQGGFYGVYLRSGDRYILRRALFDAARGPWILLRGMVTRNRELQLIGRAYISQLVPGIVQGLRSGVRTPGQSP